ncbi:peptidylprolyl isomerase [Enterobacteriaceae endosymbiont of Donacia fulgens]|uniref:peptidylprolyl isomerase n=1 Tax=Enterobacteriaceae endosymbiont of Donacia fulgens TaxID=2675778 RepID=UPI001ABFF270|nr:peptidylprolyl isomerase [Enterobacteriaceae endosymbiont of Donacia fulgens]
MIIKKAIYIIILYFCLFNISQCMPIKNIDNIKFIINDDMILKKKIDEILSITKKIYNSKYPILYLFLNIKNTKDVIKYFIFLHIIKNNNFFLPEDDFDDLISNIYQSNNIDENLLKKNFLDNNINYKKFYKIFKNIILINVLKNKFLLEDFNIYDEEIDSLSNRLYLKKKTNKIYDITLFYFLINKGYLKNKFNHKIFLLNQLIFLLKNKKLNNNLKKYNIKTFISHFNIKKNFFKNKKENQLPNNIINYLDNVKKKDIIGPIYFNSKLFIFKINNIIINNNTDNEKVLLRYIYIKKNNLSNKDFNKKIKNIYFNLLKKRITFKKAIELFSDDILSIKYKNNKNWILLNSFSLKFKKIITKLKINEFSLPIQESDGVFIIQLLDKDNIKNNKLFFSKKAYNIILQEHIEREANLFIFTYAKRIYIKNIN